MSPLEQLSQLVTLRDNGALSQAEFDAEKAKLGIGKIEMRESTAHKRSRQPLSYFLTVIVVAAAILVLALSMGMLGVSVDNQQVETGQNSTEATDEPIKPRRLEEAAHSPTDLTDKELIKQATDAWEGSQQGDDGADAAYERHTKLLEKLRERGICWGKQDQVQAEYDFHRCEPGSL
ncbi:SHOCT domain-containing protein [uncultured Sphingomonas sp.]|uniref:SHOCT domain-containing protein n=1 Tax=uncultured Sphingomonas sp. TaxID=158754 RepID=UPI0025F1A011|nr:SHOCT domain-containing protein [uncultured Sphingomonas sp.]